MTKPIAILINRFILIPLVFIILTIAGTSITTKDQAGLEPN